MKTVGLMVVPLAMVMAGSASVSVAASTATLTNADNGRTVAVKAGDEVRVRLTGGRGQGVTWAWSEPASSNPALLQRTAASTSPTGDATAVFRATGPGMSDVTATRKCIPNPGSACPLVILQWKATINVQ